MAETHTEPDADVLVTPEDLERLEQADEDWAREEAPAHAVDYDRVRRWVIQRDGKDYIQYAGLLDILHQESGGDFEIRTHLEQAPTEANGQLAIVSATVIVGGRQASGLGDASPGSVNRMMAPHLVRMAETRAKGRALRDLLNVPYVTTEELGPEGPVKDEQRGGYEASAPTPETIEVDGRTFTRQGYFFPSLTM